MEETNIDNALLERFEQEIWNKIPHLEEGKVINATPLIDLTSDFKECAKNLYKLDIYQSQNTSIHWYQVQSKSDLPFTLCMMQLKQVS